MQAHPFHAAAQQATPARWRMTRCVSWVLSALLCVQVSVHGAELKPEERLAAIRQALVDAAMKSNTRVSATSWMDSEGALREYNRFSSEIKVRELQVQAARRDAQQVPEVELSAASAEAVAPKRCDAPMAKSALMHVMALEMLMSPSLAPAQRYNAQQVGHAARARLLEAATQAKHWRLITETAHTRLYDRLMYGHGEEQVQWRVLLTVAPAPQGLTTDDLSAFTLHWHVRAPGQQHAWHNTDDLLLAAPAPLALTTPKLNAEMREAIDAAVTRMAAQLDTQLACDPQSIVVTQGDSGALTLNAGGKAGLRVGDKLMLADARVLPKHALEVGALDASVLAEVKSVSAYQAELTPIAGRKKKMQGAWVAWPYTY